MIVQAKRSTIKWQASTLVRKFLPVSIHSLKVVQPNTKSNTVATRYKWQNQQILLSWEVKRFPDTAGKAGKLTQGITIIKSTNCIHVSSDVASVMSWFWQIVQTEWITCQDFLNTTCLTTISEFPASTIGSLGYIQDFLMLIPMPSHWLQPVSPLSHINQAKANTHTHRGSPPPCLWHQFLHILTFFLN